MIQRQLKLKLSKYQENKLNQWLLHLTSIWNWAVRKIELNAKNNIYFSDFNFQNLLMNHSTKIEVPSHVIQGELRIVYETWQRCFKKKAGKPKFKGRRNKLNYIIFPDPIKDPKWNIINLPGLGKVKFHKQELPLGKIKRGVIIKRVSGWYLCLIIDTEPNEIPKISDNHIGIDPGFINLITCSNGEKVKHPKELQEGLDRIGQAQRGHNNKLVGRLHEKVANQRKDRNHKLSRQLVSENELICFSKDNLNALSKHFGKSVSSSGIGQLRSMLAYKCRSGGREYIEVNSKNSTRTCSACGCLSGPTGWAGLKVRFWVCKDCGSRHDRDINSAIVTLQIGEGISLERAQARQKSAVALTGADVQYAPPTK